MKTITDPLLVLDKLVSSIRELSLPPLGPIFSSLPSEQLHCSLVAHRLTKAYELPDNSAAVARKALSINEVLLRDSHGLDRFDYRSLPREARGDFLRARQWLSDFFRGFRHSYSLRFPSGESVESSHGRNDMIQKLKSSVHWTVSPDLVDYVSEIILRHRGLRSILRERFRRLYGAHGVRVLKRVCNASKTMQDRNIHFIGVKFMFRACCSLVRYSRVTTTRKDNERDRVITCESLWNMVAQLSFAQSLRSHMRSRLGFDLETRQGVHRALVRTGDATIDLSKASDCNFMVVLRELYPPSIYKMLERMRTGIFMMKTADGDAYHPLRMFAPMGCGCTFEVMTLTLLAHGRVLHPGATVFGDDIIINREVADRLIINLQLQGWLVNHNKSFTDGHFRESCGSFADLRKGFIPSYELERPHDSSSLYLAWHKLARLGATLPSSPLRRLIVDAYAQACRLFPRDAWRELSTYALDFGSPLSDWCFYAPKSLMDSHIESGRSNVHTALLSQQLQRPVHYRTATHRQWLPDESRFPRQLRFFMYLHRGSSYVPHVGREVMKQVRVEMDSGTPIKDFPLINML